MSRGGGVITCEDFDQHTEVCFFHLESPFWFPFGYNSHRMTVGGTYWVAEGTVLLAWYIWKLMWETVLHCL